MAVMNWLRSEAFIASSKVRVSGSDADTVKAAEREEEIVESMESARGCGSEGSRGWRSSVGARGRRDGEKVERKAVCA
jgi:hypothetical protein